MDLYNRQYFEPPETISLVGCGSGCWVGIFGAMMGVKRINLFDSDRIEEHNLNRLPYSPEQVGMKKTEALKRLIKTLRPDCEVNCYDRLGKMQYVLLEGIVFIAVDVLDDRVEIDKYCKRMKLPKIHLTIEKDALFISEQLPKGFENAISIRNGYNAPTEQVVTTATIADALALAKMCGRKVNLNVNGGNVVL